MAKRFDENELWELIRQAVALECPHLRDQGMTLVVRDGKVTGLVVAEEGEEIGALELSA